ncbi:hypothetical protein [Natrinema longum]|uniref:Uncharacterized protein n=1 Tax=Natrinema longum TaxID=370324 RepID=A0A8A2UDM9_9EURY|nr:hypothetical protein [Natrinema longum]MBZ6495302.1 hypothetical protein [Natrinema longum]QSW86720.1 hypothetical protein J0X27_07890 [Natrinema longum]
MTRPSNSSPEAFTVPRHRFDAEWRVDDEGVLHTGDSAPFANRVVVACDGGGTRP